MSSCRGWVVSWLNDEVFASGATKRASNTGRETDKSRVRSTAHEWPVARETVERASGPVHAGMICMQTGGPEMLRRRVYILLRGPHK
jgi:hypothetical protein